MKARLLKLREQFAYDIHLYIVYEDYVLVIDNTSFMYVTIDATMHLLIGTEPGCRIGEVIKVPRVGKYGEIDSGDVRRVNKKKPFMMKLLDQFLVDMETSYNVTTTGLMNDRPIYYDILDTNDKLTSWWRRFLRLYFKQKDV